MYATGRKPNSTGLGLEALGVELNSKGAIKVNSDYQTNVPSIYALGEVTDRVNLTPVAIAEGAALVNTLYTISRDRWITTISPRLFFCQPNIASVGLTEAQAREKLPEHRHLPNPFYTDKKYSFRIG